MVSLFQIVSTILRYLFEKLWICNWMAICSCVHLTVFYRYSKQKLDSTKSCYFPSELSNCSTVTLLSLKRIRSVFVHSRLIYMNFCRYSNDSILSFWYFSVAFLLEITQNETIHRKKKGSKATGVQDPFGVISNAMDFNSIHCLLFSDGVNLL